MADWIEDKFSGFLDQDLRLVETRLASAVVVLEVVRVARNSHVLVHWTGERQSVDVILSRVSLEDRLAVEGLVIPKHCKR